MSQSFSLTPRGLKQVSVSNTVTVPAASTTQLLELNLLAGVEKVSFQINNITQALDAFIVEGRVHQDASYFTIANAAGDFSAPSGRVSNVNGAPVSLAASASARFDLDTSGLYSVRVSASAASDSAVVTIYASGSAGGGGGGLVVSGGGTALIPSAAVLTTQRPAVTQVISTALEASHILKASAGQLVQLSVFNSKATSQYILILNSATLTADGAVTLLYPPIPILAASLLVLDLPAPVVASNGITVCNSSTGSFTKTIGSADCAFYAQVN